MKGAAQTRLVTVERLFLAVLKRQDYATRRLTLDRSPAEATLERQGIAHRLGVRKRVLPNVN